MNTAIFRGAALAAIIIAAPAAFAQTYTSTADEAQAIRLYQGQQTGTYVSQTDSQAAQYPIAKTYSSAAEAIAASDRSYTDFSGGSVEIFTQPVPTYSQPAASSYTETYSNPVISAGTETSYIAPTTSYSYGAPSTVNSSTQYVVVKGDNLFRIGQRFGGIKPSAIMNANGLGGSNIRVGQVLTIPSQTATVTQAQSTASYTRRAVTRNVQPVPNGDVHAVLPGDTLYSIANRSCASKEQIAALSGISVNSTLQLGQILNLPAGHCAP